jgi:tetratricopeptide (TPR) repeat protein
MQRPARAAQLIAVLLVVSWPLSSTQEQPASDPPVESSAPDSGPRWPGAGEGSIPPQNRDGSSALEGILLNGRRVPVDSVQRLPPLSVSGLVVDPSGTPVSGARATLMLLHVPSVDARARTNRQGLYRISVPRERIQPPDAPLEGVVRLEADGFEPLRLDVRWVEDGEHDVGAVLRPAGSQPVSDPGYVNVFLEGTVRDSARRPMPHAELRVRDPSGSQPPQTLTADKSGRYRAMLLRSPLTRQFEVTKPGHDGARFTLAFERLAHPQRLGRGTFDFVMPAAGTAPATREARVARPGSGDWRDRYDRGVRALESQDWPTAVQELLSAIQEEPRPTGAPAGDRSQTPLPYLPYLKLGIAYLNLGRFEEAVQAFETEERYRVVAAHRRDFENLRTFRRFAEEAQRTAAAEGDRRLAEAVRKSVDEAAALERQGRLEDALAALDAAVAISPDDPTVATARARLQEALQEKVEREAVGARVARLTSEGRAHADAARYEEAAARFRQALDLAPNAELETLLADARAKVRDQIAVGDTATSEVDRRLGEATRLGEAGLLDEALAELEAVLAIDPEKSHALELQRDLLYRREERDRDQYEDDAVAGLLEAGVELLEAGDVRQALSLFNRILAVDSENEQAQRYLQRAYATLSQSVLRAAGSLTRLPPVLLVTNRVGPVGAGVISEQVAEESVSSPDLVLSALVLDDQPTITVTCCSSDEALVATTQELTGEKVLESATAIDSHTSSVSLYRFNLTLPVRLTSGRRQLHLVVRDSDGLVAEASHWVRYEPPPWRSVWFYAAIVTFVVVSVAAGLLVRGRRRSRLLKRRFNPYVAGAPVLDDDLFVGRESLISRILETIHHNSVLIYGERRIGKTSLLHHLKRRLEALQDPAYEFFPVFIDLEGTAQEDFFATMAADLFDELGPRLPGVTGPTPAEDGSYGYRELVRDLSRVARGLAGTTDRKVKIVLLMDEVDQLNSYHPRVNQSLRKLFMKGFAENLVAVMSGISIRREWGMESSPWYNFFEEIEIGSLEDRHAEHLVREPIKGVFRLDPAVVERILELSGRKPYAIQKLCAALVNRSHESGSRRITVEDVDSLAAGAGS